MMVSDRMSNGDRLLRGQVSQAQRTGFALLAYHGALEDFFRQELAVPLSRLNSGNNGYPGWKVLMEQWELYRDISESEKAMIRKSNGFRKKIAHGDFVPVPEHHVKMYGRFVKQFVNKYGTRSYHIPTPNPFTIPTTPTPAQRRARRAETYAARQARGSSCLRTLSIVGAVLFVCYFIFSVSTLSLLGSMSSFDALLNPRPTPQFEDASSFFQENQESTPPLVVPTAPILQREPLGTLQVLQNSNIRAEPTVNSTIIGMVVAGTEYEIVEETAVGDWYKIELANGATGWVGSTRVQLFGE